MAFGKNQYYIYSYLREDHSPYYIGKGSGKRAYTKGPKEVKPPRVNIIKTDLTEEEAFLLEKLYILMFGRIDLGTGILRNKSDGGGGGGAGSAGGSNGGDGGDGTTITIGGETYTICGGGGGAGASTSGSGGSGVGGAANVQDNSSAGSGGPGIVIIEYDA